MTKSELLNILRTGEDTRHEFKVDVTTAKSIGAELAAFANGGGGWLIIGVSDEGTVVGFGSKEVRRINSLIANAASHVRPAVEFTTQNILVSDRVIIVVTVPYGTEKPYFDSEGVLWQRSGSTKSRVQAKEQLLRIFRDSDFLQGDSALIPDTGPGAIDLDELAKVMMDLGESAPRLEKTAWQLLKRLGLVRKNCLTIAGLLLFGKSPKLLKPQLSLKAVCYPGKEEEVSNTYVDSEVYEGRLSELYQGALEFLRRNLRKVHTPGTSINSRGTLEIPDTILEELLCNALLHRDYFIDAPIRLLVFKDRIEIISPGLLPGGLTIANVSKGSICIRNPRLISYAIKGLIPYRGLGSGIRRVLRICPEVRLENDTGALTFRAIVPRPTNLMSMRRLLAKQANEARFTEERQRRYDRKRSLLGYRSKRLNLPMPKGRGF